MGKHTNVLLAGLCQLCLLPIAKPGTQIALKSSINESKYEELMNEQKMFKTILVQLILKERNPLVIRELLFVLGNKVMFVQIMYWATGVFLILIFCGFLP